MKKQYTFVHSAKIARSIDFSAIHDYQIPSMVLMEHAAMEAVNIIHPFLWQNVRICILCGPGNNGGDGLAIARLLYEKGYPCKIYVPSMDKMSDDERNQYNILQKLAIPCTQSLEEIIKEIKYSDVVIDCIFGNGLSRDVTGQYQTLIEAINASHAQVWAIDVPSGLDATSGKILNCCVKATTTIALDCCKKGFFVNDGPEMCGNIQCVNIGIPQKIHKMDPSFLITEELVRTYLPERSNFAHKGSFKKALMIGGSQSMHGAITLAAKACYMSGIGTLTLMIPDCIGDILASKMEFAMNMRIKDHNGYMEANDLSQKDLSSYGLISIGNGMGQNNETIEIIKSVFRFNIPTIVDADGIWALSKNKDLLLRDCPTILTPHIKEMSYLTGKSVKEILEDPFSILHEFVQTYPSVIIVLKSSTSIICDKNSTYVLHAPNNALAKGGSGDILCGIITGLCGQSNDYLKAVVCATYIHSQSAKQDIDGACYQPQDCISEIPNVFKKIRAK